MALTSSDNPRAIAQRRRSSLLGDVVNDCVANGGDSPEIGREAIWEMAGQQVRPAGGTGSFLKSLRSE
jgi:hypothetical protein